MVAADAAKRGHSVILCEEHSEVGVPSHCSGHVGISSFRRMGMDLPPDIIENQIRGAIFHSPGGINFTLERERPVTWVLDRAGFDKYLCERASSAGAEIRLKARVTGLSSADSAIQVAAHSERGPMHIAARLVVDASGVGSPLARFMGLVEQPPSMFVNSAQVNVKQVRDVRADFVELYFGQNYAPGFFAWIIPRRDGSAKVGLACAGTSPRTMLERFVRKHPIASKKLNDPDLRKAMYHPIPVGGAVTRSYADRYLVAGDAAGQVKATTGGGIVFSIICARIAAETASQAVSTNSFSKSFLSKYEKEWRRILDLDIRAMVVLRRMLYRIPDREIDRIFTAATKMGAPRILSGGTDDIDFQGRTLLSLASRHPTFLSALAYAAFRSFPSLIWAALR